MERRLGREPQTATLVI